MTPVFHLHEFEYINMKINKYNRFAEHVLINNEVEHIENKGEESIKKGLKANNKNIKTLEYYNHDMESRSCIWYN